MPPIILTIDNCEELTGYKPDQLARLSGIEAYTTDYSFDISGTNIKPVITINSTDNNVHLRRTLLLEVHEIENDRIEIKNQAEGTGLKIFYEQVQQAKALGFKQISCIAAKSEEMNGHYTWARVGYIISEEDKEDIENYLRNCGYRGEMKEPHKIVLDPEYKDWWKTNGITWTGIFSLDDNSESMEILINYFNEKDDEN